MINCQRECVYTAFRLLVCLLFIFSLSLPTSSRADSIHVAAILPLSGHSAEWGRQSRIGIQTALEQVKMDLPNLQVHFEDSALQGKQGLSALTSLNHRFEISAVISASSPVGIALKPFAEKNRIPLLGCYTTAPSFIEGEFHPFRISARLVDELAALGEALQDVPSSTRLGVLWLENEYGESWSQESASLIKQHRVLSNEGFPVGTTDFRPLLMRLKSAELILICGIPADVGLALRQARQLGLKARFLGCQATFGNELVQVGGRDSDGFEAITCLKDDPDPKFVKTFERLINDDLNIFSTEPYFAMRLVAEAARLCGSERECIHRELLKIRKLKTQLGTLAFSSKGELENSCHLRRVSEGRFIR